MAKDKRPDEEFKRLYESGTRLFRNYSLRGLAGLSLDRVKLIEGAFQTCCSSWDAAKKRRRWRRGTAAWSRSGATPRKRRPGPTRSASRAVGAGMSRLDLAARRPEHGARDQALGARA